MGAERRGSELLMNGMSYVHACGKENCGQTILVCADSKAPVVKLPAELSVSMPNHRSQPSRG